TETRRPGTGRGHHVLVRPANKENHAVIRAHHRCKGGAAQLGATGPGRPGPFGIWPADGGCDEEDQGHEQLAGDPSAGGALSQPATG
ncbi:hypothetical protein, partial [Streptomyces lavenduligriseus]